MNVVEKYSDMIRGCKLVEIPYLDLHLKNQNENDDILIVGERLASEGILQTVLERKYNKIVCTDIMELGKDSPLDKILKTNKKVSFKQEDFIESDETNKYEYIICINVLEHFGMNFNEFSGFSGMLAGNDYIRWNHDLRAIKKMITLLNKNKTSKIIITVPAGPPVMTGDVNFENNYNDVTLETDGNLMPKLRRYDMFRINLIKKMLHEDNLNLSESFYYSKNFNEWYDSDISITTPQYSRVHDSMTPNAVWAFTITRN